MGAHLLGCAKQFIDAAFAVPNVHPARALAEQRSGTAHMNYPAQTFFLPDGHAGGIDDALERFGASELVAGPEPGRSQTQRESAGDDRQARALNVER